MRQLIGDLATIGLRFNNSTSSKTSHPAKQSRADLTPFDPNLLQVSAGPFTESPGLFSTWV
jgi:hypothetical protein